MERRHLTLDQIAAAIVGRRAIEWQPRRQQRANGKFKSNRAQDSGHGDNSLETKRDHNEKRTKLAKESGVSTYQVARAAEIYRADQELLKKDTIVPKRIDKASPFIQSTRILVGWCKSPGRRN